MPIIKEPRPLPSSLDYVPENSSRHKVSNSESWWTLAELPQVAATGMSANDLCYFNFRTRRGAEINWYLREKVGCRRPTRDGKNFVFSTADAPGIVYLPRIGGPRPVDEFPPALDTKIWVGLGVKVGMQNAVSGNENMLGFAVSIDHPERWMVLNAQMQRQGFGFGASGGISVILVSGVKHPNQLQNHRQGEFDFNFSIGGSLSRGAKAGMAAKKYGPLVRFVKRVGAKTPQAFRKALLNDPDKVAELVKMIKNNKEAWGLDPNKPNVLMIDTPAGGGGEVSVFYSTATYSAFGFHAD
jgi:hypothetical protein